MTKDLKNLIDNIYQLAMNPGDTDAVIRMIRIIHAVDEKLLVLTKERDDSRWWAKKAIDEIIEERDEARRMYCSMVENNARQYGISAKSVATQAGWNCYKETS